MTRATKTALFGSAALFAPAGRPGLMQLHGPTITRAPEDDAGGGGGAEEDPFAEQPGDRHPEPGAEADAGADQEADADADADAEADDADAGADAEADEEGEAAAEDADADAGGGADAEAEGEDGDSKPKTEPWRQRHLAKLRARAQTAETAKQTLEQENAALKALLEQAPEDRDPAVVESMRESIRAEVRTELQQQQYFETLNAGANKLFADGAKAYPNSWQQRVSEAGEVFKDELLARPDFFETIIGLENGPQVYHHLAGDMDKLEGLLKLPAHKMGVELARVSATLAKPRPTQISKVPKPIRPLDARTKTDLPLDDPNISQEEFNRRMDAAEAERAAGRR